MFTTESTSYFAQITKYCNKINFFKDGQLFTIKFPNTEQIINDTNLTYIKETISYYLNIKQEINTGVINNHYLNTTTKIVVGYGVSHGSLSLINWICEYKPKRLKCLILESTPTNIDNIITNSQEWYNKLYFFGMKYILKYTLSWAPSNNLQNNYLNLPKDLPILLITSLADKHIPYKCSLDIYNDLISNGFTKCKILILNNSKHGEYLNSNEQDKLNYLYEVNNFLSFLNQHQ